MARTSSGLTDTQTDRQPQATTIPGGQNWPLVKKETVKDAILMMRPDCYFGSIDFKHAFYSVPINPKYRKYLRFVWQGEHWQLTCLIQGLGPASRLFTKLMKPVMAHLREKGLDISGYIDDSLCIGHDASEFPDLMIYAVKFFDKLDYTVHMGKSVLPHVCITKEIEYLGFKFNSSNMTVTLTDKKKDCIQHLARKLLAATKPVLRQLAQFLGKLTASEPGFAHAPLYYKEIEIFNKTDIERWQTLGHPRSINPNMINHVAKQSPLIF